MINYAGVNIPTSLFYSLTLYLTTLKKQTIYLRQYYVSSKSSNKHVRISFDTPSLVLCFKPQTFNTSLWRLYSPLYQLLRQKHNSRPTYSTYCSAHPISSGLYGTQFKNPQFATMNQFTCEHLSSRH